MKLVTVLVVLISLVFVQCKTQQIYVVRHAEKTAASGDPELTPDGLARAAALAGLLKNKGIRQIYSTPTRRTMLTATPLSQATGVPVEVYDNNSLKQFLERTVASRRNTLIVGHSNTVPVIVNTLNPGVKVGPIADSDYDNLFLVRVRKNGKKETITSTYGQPTPD